MTTKVVKGSLWTIVGQIVPVAFTFVSTPIIIRLLGTEGYSILILVGLIPAYFSFADLGMGIASTKFASEKYGSGDDDAEAGYVQASAVVALVGTLAVAIPTIVFSHEIISWFNVPPDFRSIAAVCLRITSISFVLGVMGGVVNSPMLARLRMDLNAITSTAPKLIVAVMTPIVLYLGAGLVGAVMTGLIAGIVGILVIVYFSAKLQPRLLSFKLKSSYFRPTLRFGSDLFATSIATVLIVNLERFYLPRLTSVESLAYYSVAFTFANMASIMAVAIVQSLMPAFAQLTSPEKAPDFDALFTRCVRLISICLPPIAMGMLVVAKPFFTFWAGPEFGEYSTIPFYILLAGLAFNILAYVPYSALIASGHSALIAKLGWVELLVFSAISYVMVANFGLIGAAIAWSVRVVVDGAVIVLFGIHHTPATISFIAVLRSMLAGFIIVSPPIVIVVLFDAFSMWLIPLTAFALIFYTWVAWRFLLQDDEKVWLKGRLPIPA